jgi:hypothetical protein
MFDSGVVTLGDGANVLFAAIENTDTARRHSR